jgi:hypothetical protein
VEFEKALALDVNQLWARVLLGERAALPVASRANPFSF